MHDEPGWAEFQRLASRRGVSFPEDTPQVLAELCTRVYRAGGVVHLGVFREPFLTLLLEGKKTVESRFSKVQCPPWHKVSDGDIVLIAETGPRVRGVFIVDWARYFDLQCVPLDHLASEYGDAICSYVDPAFWQSRSDSRYATLLQVETLSSVPLVKLTKRDRRGWVTFDGPGTLF